MTGALVGLAVGGLILLCFLVAALWWLSSPDLQAPKRPSWDMNTVPAEPWPDTFPTNHGDLK